MAATAQEGVANLLGSIQETLAPKAEEKQDPEVKDFRQTLACRCHPGGRVILAVLTSLLLPKKVHTVVC